MEQNPDLIAAGADMVRVSAPALFRNVTEDGRVVESVKAFPAIKAPEKKFYSCSVPTASFHRTDGKRLGFVFGIFETDLAYDQWYLDQEIADGNPYLALASTEDINAFKFRMNPRASMREEIMSDPEVRQSLTDQILAELLRKAEPDSPLAAAIDLMKIQGASGADSQEKVKGVDVGSGILTPISRSEAPHLGGIVNSTHIQAAAQGNGAAFGLRK